MTADTIKLTIFKIQLDVAFITVCVGDDTEAGSGLGRGAVQYAAKSQPVGSTDGSAFTGRCHGRHARGRRSRRRGRVGVQQLRRAADWSAARRRGDERSVG